MKNNLFIGFENIPDFLASCFGLKLLKLNLIISCLFGLSTFISDYIYKSEAVYFMAGMVGIDLITGVCRAIKHKNYSSARLPRAFVILLTYCLLLSLSTFMANYISDYSFLPGLIYGGIISTLFTSVWENLFQLGLIKKSLYDIIKRKVKEKEIEK